MIVNKRRRQCFIYPTIPTPNHNQIHPSTIPITPPTIKKPPNHTSEKNIRHQKNKSHPHPTRSKTTNTIQTPRQSLSPIKDSQLSSNTPLPRPHKGNLPPLSVIGTQTTGQPYQSCPPEKT